MFKWGKKNNARKMEDLREAIHELNFKTTRLVNGDENTNPSVVAEVLDIVNKLRKELQKELDNESNDEMAHWLEMQLTMYDAEIGSIVLRLNSFLTKDRY